MTDYTGTPGDDSFTGGNEDDTAKGEGGNDTLVGRGGADTLDGGDGADVLFSGFYSPPNTIPWQPPLLDTESDIDTLRGGAGDDRLSAGYGDNIDGGSGIDSLTLNLSIAGTGVSFNTSDFATATGAVVGGGVIKNVEILTQITGTAFDDTIIVSAQPSENTGGLRVFGGNGNDTITISSPGGAIYGGGGADILTGGTANDSFYIEARSDVVAGEQVHGAGGGQDTLWINIAAAPGDPDLDLTGLTITGIEFFGANDADLVMKVNIAQIDALSESDDIFRIYGTFRLSGGGSLSLAGIDTDYANFILSAAGNTLDFTGVHGFTSTRSVIGDIGNDTVIGSNARDSFTGGGGNDVLRGLNGDDTLSGGNGSDRLEGGDGDDVLTGGADNDILDGGLNNDNMTGGTGDDIYYVDSFSDVVSEIAGEGTDEVRVTIAGYTLGGTLENLRFVGTGGFTGTGNALANTITSGAGNAVLSGLGGNDTLVGGLGSDNLDGGEGADAMTGGAGNDFYTVDNSGDTIIELAGEGTDEVKSSITFSIASTQVENFFLTGIAAVNATGNGLDNQIEGNDAANRIEGGDGADILRGKGGNDVLVGGLGADQLIGGLNNDTYLYQFDDISLEGADTIVELAGEGTDLVQIKRGTFVLPDNVENLTFTDWGGGFNGNVGTGNAEANVIDASATAGSKLYGLGGNDTLIGGAKFDTLDGGTGADIMRGGALGDIYIVDNIGDQVIEEEGAYDFDDVRASVDYTLSAGVEMLHLVGTGLTGTGNGLDNFMYSSGGNTLKGGVGDDFYVIKANDLVVETAGGGTDVIVVDFGGVSGAFALTDAQEIETISTMNAGAGVTLTGNALVQEINSGSGADTLIGLGGDDLIDGGQGADRLFGGTGDDTYWVDRQDDVIFENAGEGMDTVLTTASYYLYANIENLVLDESSGSMFGVGNALANDIVGNNYSNLLLGGAGDDALHGGSEVDSLFGEDGADRLFGGEGIDYLVGGAGQDQLFGGSDPDALYGEEGDDVLFGGEGFHTDILVGGAGNDILDGTSGVADYDRMDGGSGDDRYFVDTGDDLTFEAADGGIDTVYANVAGENNGVYLYANVENLVLLNTTKFGVGNELANTMTGSAGGNWLLGGAGNDVLNGKAGNDVLFGEAGADTFIFEAGTGGDVIGDFQAGTDKIDISAYFSSFAQVQAAMVENGGTTAIDLGGGSLVVLNGVANAALHASDFIFAGASPLAAEAAIPGAPAEQANLLVDPAHFVVNRGFYLPIELFI